MATGKTGYRDISATNHVTVRVTWDETYDLAGNYSVLSFGILVRSNSPYGYYGYHQYPNGTLTVDGSVVQAFSSAAGTHIVDIVAQDVFYAISGSPYSTGQIAHNGDGSKTVTVSLSMSGERNEYPFVRWECSDTFTVDLTTIPRASTIGATDANIGSVSMISVNRKSAAYTYSIQYIFGSVSGYVTESGGVSENEVQLTATSIPFVLPASFYTQIPNAKAGIGSFVCRTYSGSTQIGDAQSAGFTAYVSESLNSPTVSGTVVDINEATKTLTGDANKLVRFYSTARAAISASAKNSASIAETKINGSIPSGGMIDFSAVESGSFVFSATDSRGFSNSATVDKTLIPYVKLTNNSTAARTNPTDGNAVLTIAGDYFNGSFGSVNNALAVTYAVNGGSAISVTPGISGNQYSVNVNLSGLDYTTSHRVVVTVSDKLATVSKTLTIKQGIPIFDWGRNDFRFNVPVLVTSNIIMGGNALTGLPEPVGDMDAVRKAYADGKIGKSEFFRGAFEGDLNNCTAPGWYWLNLATCTNSPETYGWGFLEVISEVFSGGGVIQRFTFYDSGCTCVRGSVNGWSTWKWTNPPMAAGVEYLTAERWNGNDVFCRLVDCGIFTDGKSITVDIGTSICHCLYYCGYIGGFAIPHIFSKDLASVSTGYIRVQSNNTNGFAISMDGGSYMNQATYVLLKYIKA